MPKSVTLYLGPGGSHLSSRTLVIRDVSTVPPTQVYSSGALAGTVETHTFEVDDAKTFEARLTDVAGGITGAVSSIKFSTHDDGFTSGQMAVIAIDETSESSGSSSSSTSSLSSSSTSSLSSSSSSSSHSISSSSSLSSSSSSTSSSESSSRSTSSESSMSSSSTSSLSSDSASSSTSSSS